MLLSTLRKQQYLFPCVDDMLFFMPQTKEQKNPHIGMPSAWPTTHQEGPKSRHRRDIAVGTADKYRRRIVERLLYFGGGKYMVVAIRIGDFSRKI